MHSVQSDGFSHQFTGARVRFFWFCTAMAPSCVKLLKMSGRQTGWGRGGYTLSFLSAITWERRGRKQSNRAESDSERENHLAEPLFVYMCWVRQDLKLHPQHADMNPTAARRHTLQKTFGELIIVVICCCCCCCNCNYQLFFKEPPAPSYSLPGARFLHPHQYNLHSSSPV